MDDPNVTYKLAFADLTRELGRLPTATECLPLHEEYKKAYEEEKCANTAREKELSVTTTQRENAVASAAGPREEGFSRKPAPQARSIDAHASEAADLPLSGPDKPAEEAEVRSALPSPRVNPGGSGDRLVTCRTCGREFERPATRGRPPVRCEECR